MDTAVITSRRFSGKLSQFNKTSTEMVFSIKIEHLLRFSTLLQLGHVLQRFMRKFSGK